MTKNKFLKNIKALEPGKVLEKAFGTIDRSLFFDPFFKDKIYNFEPVPIGSGEESDEIELLCKMLKLLELDKTDTVLEIGTGSGYSTAIISSIVKNVVTIDYHESLVSEAKKRLLDMGAFNVKYLAGDCSEIDDSAGIFDKVIIYSACMHSPYAPLNLLRSDGLAVFPMGPAHMQQITLYCNSRKLSSSPFKKYSFLETCTCPSIKGQYGSSNPNVEIILETGNTGE